MSPFVRRARTSNAAPLGNESAFKQETDRTASARSTQLVEFERRTVGNPYSRSNSEVSPDLEEQISGTL